MGSTEADEVHGTEDVAWAERAGGRADEYLRTREGTENFPVALKLLPRARQRQLAAVYDVARVIDDLGDEAPGDRVALLTDFRADLATIWQPGAQPYLPVLRQLAPVVEECGLSERPFQALVDANIVDQTLTTCPTYADLVAYCELSANPIGQMVLEIFGASTPENVELSDRVCTALQVIEHCQDVAEDRRNGRIYLPLEDLDQFGVAPEDLDRPTTTPAVRDLVAFEAHRSAQLLASGEPLLRRLRGWARVAVTGYVAGGRAALVGLKRSNWDIMESLPHTRRLDVVMQAVAVSMRRGGRS